SASVVVNFRTMPGETLASVIEHVHEAIRDPRVEIRQVGNHREAAAPSRTDSPAYEQLARTIIEVAPEENVTVVPFLVPGGTDARYFADLSESVYRFSAIHLSKSELRRFHATDERLPVREYARAIKFYFRLIESACA